MAIEELSAGSAGVARFSQRQAKNALISNTDNPAVQQYAQVSRFTSFLTDAPQAEPQTQPVERPAPAPSYSSQPSGETEVPLVGYSARGATNPVQKPSQAGQFLNLSV